MIRGDRKGDDCGGEMIMVIGSDNGVIMVIVMVVGSGREG
jgi:hypothetical protein